MQKRPILYGKETRRKRWAEVEETCVMCKRDLYYM